MGEKLGVGSRQSWLDFEGGGNLSRRFEGTHHREVLPSPTQYRLKRSRAHDAAQSIHCRTSLRVPLFVREARQ